MKQVEIKFVIKNVSDLTPEVLPLNEAVTI